VLGGTEDELGGGEYYQLMGETGLNVPKVDVPEVWPLYQAMHQAIRKGLLCSAHAVARGGLAVHMALVAMGGELGMDIDLQEVPCTSGLTDTQILYSESAGRFVVTVDPSRKEAFEKHFSGTKAGLVGRITESPVFRVRNRHKTPIIEENVLELKQAWKSRFGHLI
ncbi:MAG: AIR synthase-related protein, partial [Deltaproteobacteria bacterium]